MMHNEKGLYFAVAVVLVGVALFTLLGSKPQEKPKEIASATPTAESPIPQEIIDDAFGPGYKAVVASITDTPDGKWAFEIVLPSQEKHIALTSEPWMKSPRVYDEALTQLEQKHRSGFSQREEYWQKVLGDPAMTKQEEGKLNVLIFNTQGQEKIMGSTQKLFQALQDDREQVIWGMSGAHATPEQIEQLDPLWSQLISVTGDCTFLLGKKISMTQEMVSAIQSKDLQKILAIEADIETLDLIYSWHEQGYQELNEKELALKKSFGLPL